MTARSNGDTFSYDANGNMTSRTQDGVTWTQVFDAENRLVSVSNNATPSTTTTYVYDGGGSRLKRIVDDGVTTTTTLYVGNMEIQKVGTTETQRTVYYGGAFRIIGGSNAGLYYVHGDHLGSVSVLSDANGMKVANSDVVYAPFGEIRAGNESELTDFGYTGQRKDDSTGGLMYYGARYYLPGIQHFISADSIVPGITSQALNRYTYVLNNPIRYSDPSGHMACEGTGACRPSSLTKGQRQWIHQYIKQKEYNVLVNQLSKYGVDIDTSRIKDYGDKVEIVKTILDGVKEDAEEAANGINASVDANRHTRDEPTKPQPVTPMQAFQWVYGPTHVIVFPDQSGIPRGVYGWNCGWEGGTPDTRCRQKHGDVVVIPDHWVILFAANKLIGPAVEAEPALTGVGLVTHEIAHNITWAGGDTYPTYLPVRTTRGVSISTSNISALRTYMTWHPGSYSNDAWEVTADVVTNLALSGFTDDNIMQHAWNWFTQNAGTFITNMANTTGG